MNTYYHSFMFNINDFIIFKTIFCYFNYLCCEIFKYVLNILPLLLKSREISRPRSGLFSFNLYRSLYTGIGREDQSLRLLDSLQCDKSNDIDLALRLAKTQTIHGVSQV